jgi:hypothetical protein
VTSYYDARDTGVASRCHFVSSRGAVIPVHNLEDAIERLYESFSIVPQARHIDGCPCCIDREEIGALLGKPLRDLTPRDLSAYASSAFLTVAAADYLYFLPRILEITATEPSWVPDREVTGRAIQSARPEVWTGEQCAALNDYLESVVGTAIQTGDYGLLDSWICAIARMGLDVRPFLDKVAKSPAAVRGYFEWNAESLQRRKKLANAFWELPCPAHDMIVAWFYSPEIAKIPYEAYGYVLTPPE